jgi:hypothetical protein
LGNGLLVTDQTKDQVLAAVRLRLEEPSEQDLNVFERGARRAKHNFAGLGQPSTPQVDRENHVDHTRAGLGASDPHGSRTLVIFVRRSCTVIVWRCDGVMV